MEFEKGKEVRIIANTNDHFYKIGSIITMDELFNDNSFKAKEGKWVVRFSDCEEIEEKVMEFKEGKEVRIIADSIGHGFKIGSIITMGELFNDNSFEAKELVNGRLYFVPFSDCEEIEKKPFGKQDLKTGMLVQFRDGDVYMFINDTFVSDEGWLSLDGFDKDLNYAYDDEYDIMKVSKVFEGYLLMPKNWNEKTLNNNLLWEREETKKMTVSEIQKELGYKIEIIE